MVWIEFAVLLVLALFAPVWGNLIPISPNQAAGCSPAVLAIFAVAVCLNLAGLLMSMPKLRRLPRSVWSGWTFGHKERTPSLMDISDPWLGVSYAPLFNPNKIRAGRMVIRGWDTTAALASCASVLLCAGALLAGGITGELSAAVFIVSIPFALALAGLSAAMGCAVYGIGRADERGKKRQGQQKNVEKMIAAKDTLVSNNLGWLLQLPYLVCLYGFTASIMPLLSLHLDTSPVSGPAAIFYLAVRACLLTLILMLLLHAPLKLMMLSSRRPHLAPRVIYAVACTAFFIWLLLDWFFQIP